MSKRNETYPDNDELSQPLIYVGIGASAGGLEALDNFFSNMPPDSGMAFIIIQHLSPDYKSMMVELLGKRTTMGVYRAEEGMPVQANTLYLIPPRKQLSIFHGKLLLKETDPHQGINLPIDVFLSSLAEDQGEKSVAIILSGTGSDGVRGIRAVKEAGGLIMAQNEESAKFDGMPKAAINTGLVDIVLPPREMPRRLLSFLDRPFHQSNDLPSQPRRLSDEDSLTRLYALLREHTKVDFTHYKSSTIIRRIDRRMTVNQIDELPEYVRMLEDHPGEINTLYRELLIGVTNFFRDKEVFDELAKTYLPNLIRNSAGRELRMWVAGCSTGEEVYTLAILCRECMEQIKQRAMIKIFATDIDRDAIMFAGNGLYPDNIAADLPPGVLGKYFVHNGEQYRISSSIREMVVFAHHNLIKDPPFTRTDLISCRNLLIYLEPVLQQKVMGFFNFSLNPNGILLLGTSETPGEAGDYFEPLHQKHKIYRSRGIKRLPGDGPDISTPGETGDKSRPPGRKYRNLYPHQDYRHGRNLREEEKLQERLLQSLAGDYLPLIAVVSEDMELQHLVGNGEGFLHIPPGRAAYDITRMVVKELTIPLATGLQRVFQGKGEAKYTNIRLSGHHANAGESSRVVQMHIRLLPGRQGQEQLAAVFLSEAQEQNYFVSDKSNGQIKEFDLSQDVEQRIYDLEQELQFTKENLQATIQELETSNEELQATNEELLASNEELQSTNEELQSVNEELHTVNSEYQGKIMELTETTNDLDNLIAASRIATLFLDENLDIRRFTPDIHEIYHLQQADVGRPIMHLKHNLTNIEPMDIIRDVMETGKKQEIEVKTTNDSWYYMRVLPYDIGGPAPAGAVVTFINITPLKESEAGLIRERAQLHSIFNSINYVIYVADMDTHEILFANEKAREVFGNNIIGKKCYRMLQSKTEPCAFCTNNIISENLYQPYEWEHYNPVTGRHYHLTDQMIHWSEDRRVRFQIAVDITDRKRAEDELKREAAILKATEELTGVGGWEWDAEKEEMYWTAQVYKIHGFNRDELTPGSDEHITRSLECYHPDDRQIIAAAFNKCCNEGVPYDLKCRFTDLRGQAMEIRTMARPVYDKGRIVKVVGNIMIISE